MTRVGEDAVAWAANQVIHPSQNWKDMCLKFVRSSFDAPGMGGTALGAWGRAAHKHAGDLNPPRAVPFFFDDGHGGGQGHVVLALGDGTCFSSDARRVGMIDRVTLASIHSNWGMRMLGWTEDINGVIVHTSAIPPAWPPLAGYDRRYSGTTWYYAKHTDPSVIINQPLPLPRSGYNRVWNGKAWDYIKK